MAAPMVNLRASGSLESELSSRGDSMNAVALRDLRRYYASLDTALREIQLSRAEWDFLRDILNGSLLDSGDDLPMEIVDADPETAEKWGVSLDALAGRVRTMPAFSRLAIVDAIERYWRRP